VTRTKRAATWPLNVVDQMAVWPGSTLNAYPAFVCPVVEIISMPKSAERLPVFVMVPPTIVD
jgi:hypothetical protein